MAVDERVEKLEAEGLLTPEKESQMSIVWRRFRRHKLALIGSILICVFLLMAIFATVFAYYDPITHQDLLHKNASPDLSPKAIWLFISAKLNLTEEAPPYLLGTDEVGRDIFSRLLFAARISLTVAFVVTFFSQLIGAVLGGVSGYFGGWVDNIVQRIVDFLLTIPLLPLLLAFSSLLRGIPIPFVDDQWSSVVIISVILIVFGWMGSCRLVRGMVLSLRNLDFSEAARALGMSDLRVIIQHMIPNAMAPIIVSSTLGLGGVIVLESALSFLGFGVQLPVPTWGNMLQSAQRGMLGNPGKVIPPGLAIFLTSLAFNYVGDGLRDALDPRLKL